jgi:DNA polymerase sigma
VPIVKIWDPELNLACDLNVNNQVAVKNTKLVKTYIELDDRVRPLAMIVKHWTKKRVINEG